MPYYPPGGGPHASSHENGGADEIDATGLDGVGGGAAQFDEDANRYRIKTGFDTLSQEDPADGTEADISLIEGVITITAGDGTDSASIELDGTSGDVQIAAGAGAGSDIELLADDSVLLSVGTGRIIMAGGIGVTFPALAADPTPVGTNLTYYNTVSDKLRTWDGAAWADTGSGGVSDHGGLTGLADDDHPQYATNTEFDDHSARHENGGADELSIAGLDGTPVELTNHLNDAADAHDASAISVVPAGNITSTTVQAALVELDGDIAAGGIPGTIVDAKGDLIVATAADTVGRLAAGTNGHVLTADSAEATGLKWAAAGGGGGILGATSYDSGADTAWASSSSTTPADIDATNASLAITVPASGKIVVQCSLDFTTTVANNGGFLWLRSGSTNHQSSALIGPNGASGGIGAITISANHANALFYVSGLTPGALTIKIGLSAISSSTVQVYAHNGLGTAGNLASPFVMVAFAA